MWYKTCPFCDSTKPRPDRELRNLHHWQKLEIKPLRVWLFWMVRHHMSQHIHVRAALHRESFPNFMNAWTLSRWIRRWFVQIWLSIILSICRHCIECIMWRDFHLDRTHVGQIELRWVYDCSRSFSLHCGYSSWKSGRDHSVANHTCSVDA